MNMKFQLLLKSKMVDKMTFLALKLSDVVFILLITVKITFMSRINFTLRCIEHEKTFITMRPGLQVIKLFHV